MTKCCNIFFSKAVKFIQLSLRLEIKTPSIAKWSPGKSYDQSDTTEGQFSGSNLQFDVRFA